MLTGSRSRAAFLLFLPPLLPMLVCAQADSKQKIKAARDLYKSSGASAITELAGYLQDTDPAVRRETVRLLVETGTPASLDPLLAAAKDADAEVQSRALGGLVNVYLPGYANRGNVFTRTGRGVKGKVTDMNDQVIERYIIVRPEVIGGVTWLIARGANLEVRADAARAAGVLRAKPAVPALVEALKSKDTGLLYESLNAIQKIGDAAAAPGIQFLLQDLNPRVQVAAIETSGLLRNRSALPGLREALSRASTEKVRSSALTALSMIPDEASRGYFETYLSDRDDDTRASAAEGFGRLGNAADKDRMKQAFEAETKMKPRLAMAFAAALLGEHAITELAPFTYLLNSLNSSSWKGVASAYLAEALRQEPLRLPLYAGMAQRTKAEKIELAAILARSGGQDAAAPLEALSRDSDSAVAEAGARSLRNLRARLTP
ncbi:MAG: HEAT repeat domain-containing protein [Acidobacteria bacterium]|nr:HEAT repeat domain-containing protein [Acidobacteriota bacterium]